jgi:hypothetical protein
MKTDVSSSVPLVMRIATLRFRSSIKSRMRVGCTLVFAILTTTLLGACAQMGPQALATGRPQYNIAVQQTEAEQLLLNIVRQRYSDPVLFLDVTSISSGFSRGANTSLLSSFGSGSNNGVGTLGGNIGENPYIFYAPNTGEKFVRQMLTPLDIGTVALILQAGWSIERVLLLLGESANQLYNRSIGSEAGDRYSQFLNVADSLRDLQRNGQLAIGLEPGADTGASALILIVAPDAAGSAPYLAVCNAMGVACDGQPLRVRQAFGAPADGKTLALATRSLFSAIYYLSRHVDAPAKDVMAGIVSPGPDMNAELSDAASALRRLFHVHSSEHEPENASVKIHYRNAWFYIADNDQDSKTTFALLSMLITLQSGDTTGVMPLITLPSG